MSWRRSKSAAAAATLLATVSVTAAGAVAASTPPIEHQSIPGASPEPIVESAGLRTREDLEAFFDGVMTAHLKAQRIAGATLSVVKDGEVFFAKGYGHADLEQKIPVDPERTLFRVGSTSKLFTWTAILQLMEQGKVDLDADVNTYVKQFQIPATFPQPITLRNLMTHTPGLEDGAFGYLIVKTKEQSPPLADALKAHIPARVRPPTTDWSDGTNASYSNWGTALAGLIVANVSGMSFDEYVEKNIFQPLGMNNSSFREPLPQDLIGNMSKGYRYRSAHEAGDFEYIHHFGPAGSMSSSATDMARFMIAQLQNGRFGETRILEEETARFAHSRQFSPSPYVNGSGLGFYETWVNGRRFIGHAGDTIYFHTDLALLESENLGLFVSYNGGPVLPFSARTDLLQAFMDRYYPATLPVVEPPADFETRAAQYAGSYRFSRHSFTKNEKLLGILQSLKVAPTDHDTLLVSLLGEVVPGEFVEVAPDTFRRVDSADTIAFVRNADGAVTHFVGWPLAFLAAYKLAWYQHVELYGVIAALALLCAVVAIVSALRNWKADRAASPTRRGARRLAAALGLVLLLFVVGTTVTFASSMDELMYGFPPVFRVALAAPLLAIPLTLGVLWFAWRAWRDPSWTRFARVRYSLAALVFVAFLLVLNAVNLIGYRFG
jgi:CubicO group peptidase (beta-lactamase class C family)